MARAAGAIADYALLSDCNSAALVSLEGSVDWLCWPRFDSPSVFGRLLGAQAGHWRLAPRGATRGRRRYRERTLVLETTFETPDGTAVVVDALAVGRNERGHELGLEVPRVLLRQVRCLSGAVELDCELAARPEYGLLVPRLVAVECGLLVQGGADLLRLSSPVPLRVEGGTASARFALRAGEQVGFSLQHRLRAEPAAQPWSGEEIARRLEETEAGWLTWSQMHQAYEGPWRELVHQSGRILQALTFAPTGAIVAAATTSLPEVLGGERNWDYRYAWIRDASLTLDALWVAACPDEAVRFFQFLSSAAASQAARGGLQIMLGVGGEHDLSERVLDWLEGFGGSRPVRVGNAAWQQHQLDVYGELLTAAHRLSAQLGDLDEAGRALLCEAAEEALRRWDEADQGIWEVRGEARQFLHSKLMCWAALDRAIGLADLLGAGGEVERWARERERMRSTFLERGWSPRARAFTQAFGSDELDASALLIPILGLLPADDPRVLATIDAVAAGLDDGHGLLLRYRAPDGLAGEEGAFLLCSFWLAQAQALAGRLEQAKATFARAAGCANDLGLLAEEVDSATGELLGNFPQAFSHIGLVNAAWEISQAEQRRG